MHTTLPRTTEGETPLSTGEMTNALILDSRLQAISDDGLYLVDFHSDRFFVWMPSAPINERNGSFDFHDFTRFYAKKRWNLIIVR